MAVDQAFIERNRVSRERLRAMALLSEADMQRRVGQHWTVAIVLAHLAFWDRRVMYVLDMTEKEGRLVIPEIETAVNDISLPLWAAIPPEAAARLAMENAEELDRRLEAFPPDLLEEISVYNRRWVERSLHRNNHLDEADAALKD